MRKTPEYKTAWRRGVILAYRQTIAGKAISVVDRVRRLWSAVVLQAREDLLDQPYTSVAYGDAEAFFFATTGTWPGARRAVADCLELSPDDIRRGGRTALAARAAIDGGPPVIAPPKPVPRAPPRADPPPWPDIRATPAPGKPRRVKPVHDRNWWISRFLAREGGDRAAE